MSKDDGETIIPRLKVEEYLNDNEHWNTNFNNILEYGIKTELECLSALYSDYLTEIYLPKKFKELDFI
ncbi:hypothetical protein FRX31_018573 [Thalictrum thalictroides]|uniref:Topoisomerase 6 subunit A/Spo11 TOPRIM domain-containing protein n=1 Tax=Thalictrum thalictroides TaxID=46969 RepID=A0A7J6W4E7_THATH|nr:hypothetical protein FRX31_018573 [Thalictrum thalictroides]